jgi:hypothetical protein
LTFLTRKKTLQSNQANFRTYCRRNYDSSLWLSLTKFSIFNPAQTLRFALTELWLAKIVAKAWLYGWTQIVFGKRVMLWVPVPAIATHLDAKALSPNFDWPAIIREQAEQIDLEKSVDSGVRESRVRSTSV